MACVAAGYPTRLVQTELPAGLQALDVWLLWLALAARGGIVNRRRGLRLRPLTGVRWDTISRVLLAPETSPQLSLYRNHYVI